MAHSLGVVVNQRDRYDWPEALIAALLQNLPAGTPVLFVDGGSPPAVRDVLQRSAEQWGFELLRREAFISANQARLLALERLSVSYLLCVENDVRLAPGCAEALVAAAERHWADVVVPLVLEENDLGQQRIHLAGGTCRLHRTWGGDAAVCSSTSTPLDLRSTTFRACSHRTCGIPRPAAENLLRSRSPPARRRYREPA